MQAVQAFFLSAAGGQRLCLLHPPPAGHAVRGGVVYIHPFAEELNRSRRMAAQQARAFAQAGYAVLQIDLDGCGDSAGEFGEARWASWVADGVLARQYLADHLNCAPHALWLWGLRAGCLLAAAVAREDPDTPAKLLFWQPVLSGQQHLNQFLRLKIATDLVKGNRGGGTAELVQQLAAGQVVEVGGYTVAPALAHGLALADLEALSPASRVVCLEVSGSGGQSVSPALEAQLARWQAAGCQATGHAIEGPLFWQLAESEACPALVAASLDAIRGAAA